MATGMWTAVSGAAVQAQQVDSIANNLANANTDGYKKDVPTFKEYLSSIEKQSERVPDIKDLSPAPLKDKDLFPLDGKDTSHVVVDSTHIDFKQGPMKVTQRPLDIGIDGPGFLEVSTPVGNRFTRHGSLKIAQDGKLVTTDGYPVLAATPGGLAAAQQASMLGQPGQGGPETQGGVSVDLAATAARWINLKDRNGSIAITPSGDLYVGEEKIAKLAVVEFVQPGLLRKTGHQLFENNAQLNPPQQPQFTKLQQGMLEGSNVNPVQEMTNLVKANRNFDLNVKSIKTFGEVMSREANDVGKL